MRNPSLLPGAVVGALVAGWVVCASAAGLEARIPGHRVSAITLRPAEGFGDNWAERADMPVFCDVEGAGLEGGLYQSKDKLRLAFRLAKDTRGGPAPTDLVLGFDPVYFFIEGSPVLVDTSTGSRREVDYRFEHELIILDSMQVGDRLQYVELNVCSRKLRNRGTLTIADRLKQARTIRRIRPKLDSWSPLAAGQIIAQETLRPIVCHGGYDVNGTKQAVIWANGGKLTGEFELIDALRNRQHPARQPVVYRGALQERGSHVWGGNNYVADFSDFHEEGLYFVRLRVAETKEVVDSYVFPIRNGLYLDLARKAGRWFYYQRCGMEVPGFHKACHTQDAIIKTDGTRVDVTGGWHDAGDYGKWIWGGSMGLFALTTFQDEFGGELGDTLENMPRFINEAAWEAEYFCKTYWDGGFHAGFTPDFEDVCTWLGAPENEPPRVVSEAQTLELDYGITKGPAICMTGAILARAGRLIAPHNEELAKRCIGVARDVYDRCQKMDVSRPMPGLLLADLELYQITGEQAYARDAERQVKRILSFQDEEGFFYSDESRTVEVMEPRYHLPALYEFVRLNPESELSPRIKAAFRRWADCALGFTDLSPFGQIGGKADDGTTRNIKPNTNNGRFGEMAWGLATAARLLEEPKYLKAAEQQLQWILGFNPADVSMMADVGRGPGCYHTRYCFMEGCESGVVPGGITLGIVAGTGDTIGLGDMDTKNFVIARVPIDYPIIDTDVWGWTYAYKTSEYALAKGASFIRAAAQIEKALRELR